jgi:two-component sensor histidine kinase
MNRTPMGQAEDSKAELEELRSELESQGRNNLQLILSLVKLQQEYPPSTAVSALARVSGQIQILSSAYDESVHRDGIVEIASWCKAFFSSIAPGLVHPGTIAFSAGPCATRILRRDGQSLGFAIVELLADASERASALGRPPQVEVTLAGEGDGRAILRFSDDQASHGLPRLASILVELGGGSLREKADAKRTERELVFEASVPKAPRPDKT